MDIFTASGANCSSCRHHSKVTRSKVLTHDDSEQVGLDFEAIATSDDELEDVYFCHKQNGSLIGIGEEAGVGCEIYEAGSRRGLDENLEKILNRWAIDKGHPND